MMIRYVYMFFVGLFLAVFVGTGIAVFYPSPKAPVPPTWFGRTERIQLTDAERQEEQEFALSQQAYEQDMAVYNRNVSIYALSLAIVVLIISLTFSERLGVVADGLLLGGVFTLLYGIGRGMATDDNQYRFIVAAFGLVITIVIGYIRFSMGPLRRKKMKLV